VPAPDGTSCVEAIQYIAERNVKQADVWPAGTNRTKTIDDRSCDRQHLMPARVEGSCQRLTENPLVVADD
jgi:hypothetical protein